MGNYVNEFDLFGVAARQLPCQVGKGAPNDGTPGAVGELYMDENTGSVYKCTAVGVWSEIESQGGASPEAITAAVNAALIEAKESGDFDGPQGPAGKDGVSPTVTPSKSGKVTTLTIKDASGTKTATINDGADGKDGSNGVSATHSWNGTTLTITSASGTSSANLKGDKGDTGATGPAGKTPVKGTDYWTAEDQASMVQQIIAALPDVTGVKY